MTDPGNMQDARYMRVTREPRNLMQYTHDIDAHHGDVKQVPRAVEIAEPN